MLLLALALASELMVGVLEQREWRVRAAFRHGPDGWQAMPHQADDEVALEELSASFPQAVEWTIALDGKRIGKVWSKQRRFEQFAEAGQMDIARAKVRRTGRERVIAVSAPNVADPDRWKPAPADARSRAKALAALRKEVPARDVCDPESNPKPPRDYADSEVKSLTSYRSRKGDRIVTLKIADTDQNCDYGDEEVPWLESHTYALTASGELVALGANLSLIDAGDWDGDGSSELVFFTDDGAGNHQGYLLVTADLRSAVLFDWYHH